MREYGSLLCDRSRSLERLAELGGGLSSDEQQRTDEVPRSTRKPQGEGVPLGLFEPGTNRFMMKGHVSLYLDGNLESIGAAWIRLENGGMLDLYVSGSVRQIGHLDLGNKWDPSAFRLYIGGGDKGTINIGNQIYNGAIYAPNAEIEYIGNTQIRGAITAKRLTGIGNLEIGYAAPECPVEDPDPTPPPPPSDAEPPVLL